MAQITLIFDHPATHGYADKVGVIKAIRTLTGLGLKESKDMSETCGEQSVTLGSHLTDTVIQEQYRILKLNNVGIGSTMSGLLDDIRTVAAKALKIGEDEFASELLQLVLAEKLRRKPDQI